MLPLSLKKDEIKDEKMMTIDASCQSPHQIYSRREAWRILPGIRKCDSMQYDGEAKLTCSR